jgi:hypothetical protein
MLINETHASDKEVQLINDERKVWDNLLRIFDQQSKENSIKNEFVF